MKRDLFTFASVILFSALALACCGVSSVKSLSTEEARAALTLPQTPDSAQLSAAAQTARIWGFAKYHHPAFSNKSMNADAEYFTLLNRIINSPDSARNGIFADWIAALGPFSTREGADERLEVFNDFGWVADTLLLGGPLSHMLTEIRRADPGKNRYVKQTPVNVSYIEPQYTDIPDDDIAYRLLGVAKFWNAVDSYSPNRNLTDRPWDEVLADYTAMAFDRSVDFQALYSRMVTELCDSHVNSWFIPIFGGRFVPALCRFAEERLFVADTCTLVANDFRVGDEILRIDGKSPAARLAELAPYIPHSNRASLLRYGSYASLLTAKSEVQVEYRRDGDVRSSTISTVAGEDFVGRIYKHMYSPEKPTFEEVADGIACIRIGSLTCADEKELEGLLQQYDKLIIDLRAYPAEYDVIHRLLPKYLFSEAREYIAVLLPQADTPGAVIRKVESTARTYDPDKLFGGKVVLLVDACSQSMSEYFTMSLQTIPGAVTIGSQTAGADGDVTRIQLPYASFNLTGLGVCYPDGQNAQRSGVKIDIVVEPTAEGMRQGMDEQMQAAIGYLNGSDI